MDPNCSLSLTLDGRSGRTPHPCVSPSPCGWHWKRHTKPTHSTRRSQAAPPRPVRRPAARRLSSWLGRRVASLRPGWPCRGKPWAEAPSEPLPPQTTDVDRPGLRSASTGLALEDLGWSWGRLRKDRAAQPAWRQRLRPLCLLLVLAPWSLPPPCFSGASVAPRVSGMHSSVSVTTPNACCRERTSCPQAWASADGGPAGLPAAASSWSRSGHEQGVGILLAVHLCFH